MRHGLTLGFALAFASWPLSALAQNPPDDCPPGAWFCDEAEGGQAPDATQPPPPPPPPPSAEPAPPPAQAAPAGPPGSQPPVVYRAPPGSQVVVVTSGPGIRAMPLPMPRRRPWRPQWAFNLRLQGAMLGESAKHEGAGMGGVGMSLRYRPIPRFAFDFGLDFMGGKDTMSRERVEVPLSASGLVYLNPRSRWQFYLLGGLHYSNASVEAHPSPVFDRRVDIDDASALHFSYLGGQGGGGVEIRWPRFSLNADLLGFVRGRIDDTPGPEFVSADGRRATNTSGGGLFRLGMSFWW